MRTVIEFIDNLTELHFLQLRKVRPGKVTWLAKTIKYWKKMAPKSFFTI